MKEYSIGITFPRCDGRTSDELRGLCRPPNSWGRPDRTDRGLLGLPGQYQGDYAESLRAKYVVGGDGAHSWVREQLAIRMQGEKTEKQFGVMDIIPLTDTEWAPGGRIYPACFVVGAQSA